MEVDPARRRAVDAAIYYHGVYELGTVNVIARVVAPGQTVVDVGAYSGLISLLASKVVGDRGAVHAFEPHPDTRALLIRNVQMNNASNVIVHPEAIGSETGTAVLYDHPDNAGADTLHTIEGATSHQVAIRPLDDFDLAPSFIKIDVEGWEIEALKGAVGTLHRHRPALCVESSRTASRGSAEEVVQYLESLDYRLFTLAGGKDTLTALRPIQHLPRHDNIFCFHRESDVAPQ